jgi:hypothetical protein
VTRAIRSAFASALVGLVVLAVPASAAAETFRVDDTAALPSETTALLRWRDFAPSGGAQETLEGTIAVAVRLNLTAVLNRTGRLYLVLPKQGTTPVRVSWATQGRLLPGEISPGLRTLVYQGPVTSPYLEETLALRIEADGNFLPGMQRLDFYFEFDAD